MSLKTEQPERDIPPEHTLLCTVLKSFLDDARCISGRKGPAWAQMRGQILVTHAQSEWIGTVCELVDVSQGVFVGLLKKAVEERLKQLRRKKHGS